MLDHDALRDLFVKCGADVDPDNDLLWRTWERPLHHERTVMNHVLQTTQDINKGKTSSSDGSRCLVSPLYNRIIQIYHKLEFVIRYFCGEFEIQCKDRYFREQFANIWLEFIRGWYFGEIYVGYGEDFKMLDNMKLKADGLNPDLEGIRGRWRLFTRSKNGEFTSVFTRLSGIKLSLEQQSRLVKCTCGGQFNWHYWWFLWNEWMDGMDRFNESVKWLSKQAILTPKNQIETANIMKQGNDTTPFIVRNSSAPGSDSSSEISGNPLGKTKFEEIEVMNNDTPMRIFEAVNRYFEINAAHVGFAGKVQEQKKERINAGENFPYQKVVCNVRTHLINSLNLCFDHMREKFGEKVVPPDLKIIPSNQSFAQGLPNQQFGGTFNNMFGEAGGFQEKKFMWDKSQYIDKRTGND